MLDLYEHLWESSPAGDATTVTSSTGPLKCGRCGRMSNVLSRFVACGAIHCTRPEYASTQINRFLDDIVVWQVRLCQTCLEPAQEDSLKAREGQAFMGLILKAPITALLALVGSCTLIFKDPHEKSGLADVVVPIMTVISGIVLIATLYEYATATFKRRRWQSGKRMSGDVNSAFEGEAYRLLKARDTTAHPKPKFQNRPGVPDESDVRVLGVAEKRADLESSLDTEWQDLLHRNTPKHGSKGILALAARRTDLGQIKQLLQSGHDPNEADESGDLPLNSAFLGIEQRTDSTDVKVVQIARELVSSGADPNGKSPKGWTPLHGAALIGLPLTATFLLESKAAINAAAEGGATPLMAAARAGHINVVQILLTFGAAVNLKADNGLTAADIAAEWNQDRVAQLLQSAQDGKA